MFKIQTKYFLLVGCFLSVFLIFGVKPVYAQSNFLSDSACVGAWRFDETTGDAIDLCAQDGATQDGSVHSDVVRGGSHYTFNGDSGHVDFGDVTFLDSKDTASFCLEAKVNTDDLIATYISLFRKDGAWTPMQWDGSKWRALLWTTAKAQHNGIDTWILDDGQWHSYCYTYDGVQRKAYRDGVVIPGGTYTDSGNLYDSTNMFYIGGSGTSESFKGDVKNVIIFDRKLDDPEVMDLHQNGFDGSGDMTPPVISNPQETLLTKNSVTITWDTDEPATSKVDYGVDTNYGMTEENVSLATLHSVTLSDLDSNTLYHYQITSVDASSNTGTLADDTFITLANNPPVLDLIGPQNGVERTLLEFTINATDTDAGDTLVYSEGNLPAGATFNATTRTFSWTNPVAGTYPNVHFEVTDGEDIDSEDISITISPISSGEGFLNDTNCVGAWRFDETTGDAIDLCAQDGATQDGTVHSDVVRGGTHYTFNGDSGHVDFGDVTFLDSKNTASFCLEAKVNTDDLIATYISLFRKDGAWTPMQWDGSKWRALLWTTAKAQHNGIDTWILDDGQWHSYCYTYDGVQRKAYRDGVVIPGGTYTDSGNLYDSTNMFYIGGSGTSESFKGDVKNVIIFDRKLDDPEVMDLHQNGFDGDSPTTGQQIIYTYDDLNRLTSVIYDNVTITYTYDEVGNITSRVISNTN